MADVVILTGSCNHMGCYIQGGVTIQPIQYVLAVGAMSGSLIATTPFNITEDRLQRF